MLVMARCTAQGWHVTGAPHHQQQQQQRQQWRCTNAMLGCCEAASHLPLACTTSSYCPLPAIRYQGSEQYPLPGTHISWPTHTKQRPQPTYGLQQGWGGGCACLHRARADKQHM
jgi:hypothetical protein